MMIDNVPLLDHFTHLPPRPSWCNCITVFVYTNNQCSHYHYYVSTVVSFLSGAIFFFFFLELTVVSFPPPICLVFSFTHLHFSPNTQQTNNFPSIQTHHLTHNFLFSPLETSCCGLSRSSCWDWLPSRWAAGIPSWDFTGTSPNVRKTISWIPCFPLLIFYLVILEHIFIGVPKEKNIDDICLVVISFEISFFVNLKVDSQFDWVYNSRLKVISLQNFNFIDSLLSHPHYSCLRSPVPFWSFVCNMFSLLRYISPNII